MRGQEALRLLTPQDYLHLMQGLLTFVIVVAIVAMLLLAYGWCPDPKAHAKKPTRRGPSDPRVTVFCKLHQTSLADCEQYHGKKKKEDR